jgi:hypothetical protein
MPQFSRNTVVELVDALAFSSHAQIETFLIRFEMEEADNRSTLDPRTIGIIKYLIDHPDKTGPFGANLVVEILEYLIETRCHYQEPEEVFPRLVRSLKRNGYLIENGNLQTMLPEDLQMSRIEDELTTLLDQFGFSTAKGHFTQAVSTYTRGEWAAANAQLRSFVESLFDSIAKLLVDDKTELPSTSHGRRELLTKLNPPFLLVDLNEWESNGKGFVQGFWNRLHPQGSHPGLSDEEDGTFRLYLVIIIASHYLRRLNTRR